MIHLTLILVDFLTSLLMAGAWALLGIVAAIAGMAGAIVAAVMLIRRWRR